MLKFKLETEFRETEIGEIPTEWKTSILGDQQKFSVIMGQSPPSQYYNQDGKGMPFIQGKTEFREIYVSIITYTTKCAKIAPPYSVLITVRAPVGELNITKGELCIGRGVAAVLNRSGDPLQNKFIYYTLKGLNEHLSMLGERGTTYDSITKEDLDKLPFPYPSTGEQSRIATVLSWFDDLIENKKTQNEILEKIAMAIYRSWFIEFESFKNKGFIDSKLGKMPRGWAVKSVPDLADIFLGGTPRREKSRYWNGQIKWAAAKDVANTEGIYVLDTAERITEEGLDNSNAKILSQDSLVITARGTVGELRLLGEGIAFNQTCYGLVPKDQKDAYFLFLSLRHITNEIKALSYGTVFDTITIKTFNDMNVVVPPQPILEKFHSIIRPLFHKILLNQKQVRILKEVRDVLLPLLVFGKLRVEEI
jgi:type I restriction enzyme S subunit